MCIHDDIQNLRKDMEALVPLADLVKAAQNKPGSGWKEYRVPSGRAVGHELLVVPGKFAIQRVLMDKGTEFPEHMHADCVEIGIVVEGSLLLWYRGKKTQLGAGDHMVFGPNEGHRGLTLEDTEIVVVSCPPDLGYPGVGI